MDKEKRAVASGAGAQRKDARVTIVTVADAAGVSVATASKVLRDAYGVSEVAKGKVRAAMTRLNYRPRTAARGMRGQTYTLGVLLPDLRNPFFAELMSGVNHFLSTTPYHALLGIGQSTAGVEQALVDSMMDRQMDGLILVAPSLSAAALDDVARLVPTVLIGVHEPAATGYDTVNNDDRESGRIAVRQLFDIGRGRIAYFSLAGPGTAENSPTIFREHGYREALREVGLGGAARVVRAEQSRNAIWTAAERLLAGNQRPDAIFCWTDFVAFELMSVARRLGLRVPDDVAIVGHDNTAPADLEIVALTSIDQSGPQIGRDAARLLIERIAGRTESRHLVTQPRLVVRASSGR